MVARSASVAASTGMPERFIGKAASSTSAFCGCVAINPHTNEDLAAVGIMIDDVDMENGPMMVVLGSHKGRSTTTMAGRTVLRRDGPG